MAEQKSNELANEEELLLAELKKLENETQDNQNKITETHRRLNSKTNDSQSNTKVASNYRPPSYRNVPAGRDNFNTISHKPSKLEGHGSEQRHPEKRDRYSKQYQQSPQHAPEHTQYLKTIEAPARDRFGQNLNSNTMPRRQSNEPRPNMYKRSNSNSSLHGGQTKPMGGPPSQREQATYKSKQRSGSVVNQTESVTMMRPAKKYFGDGNRRHSGQAQKQYV
jgi:hypothetical protein